MVEENPQSNSDANDPDLLNLYTVARCLDGVFWCLLVFYVILITTFKDLIFSTFPFLVCLPLFVLSYISFKLPMNFIADPSWRKNVHNLKVFSLIAAFNFPFIVFLVRGEASNQFAICSIIAIYGVMRILTGVAVMARQLGEFYKEPGLAKESKVAVVFLYVAVLTAMAYLLLATTQPALFSNLMNNSSMGMIIKVSMLIVIVFPLLLPVTLLFRLKTLIIINTKEKMRKY